MGREVRQMDVSSRLKIRERAMIGALETTFAGNLESILSLVHSLVPANQTAQSVFLCSLAFAGSPGCGTKTKPQEPGRHSGCDRELWEDDDNEGRADCLGL